MRVKGTTLRSRLEFLRERFGDDSIATVLEGLDLEHRKAVESALPGSWIDFGIVDRLDREIIDRFGAGRDKLAREFGAFSAHKNLTSLYKIFIERAQGDPHALFENLSNLPAVSTTVAACACRASASAPRASRSTTRARRRGPTA